MFLTPSSPKEPLSLHRVILVGGDHFLVIISGRIEPEALMLNKIIIQLLSRVFVS